MPSRSLMKSHATAVIFFSIMRRRVSLGCTLSCRAEKRICLGRSISISRWLGGATFRIRSALYTWSALSTTMAPASLKSLSW